jgi:hypothetical protein
VSSITLRKCMWATDTARSRPRADTRRRRGASCLGCSPVLLLLRVTATGGCAATVCASRLANGGASSKVMFGFDDMAAALLTTVWLVRVSRRSSPFVLLAHIAIITTPSIIRNPQTATTHTTSLEPALTWGDPPPGAPPHSSLMPSPMDGQWCKRGVCERRGRLLGHSKQHHPCVTCSVVQSSTQTTVRFSENLHSLPSNTACCSCLAALPDTTPFAERKWCVRQRHGPAPCRGDH